jgi:hypothetical protein
MCNVDPKTVIPFGKLMIPGRVPWVKLLAAAIRKKSKMSARLHKTRATHRGKMQPRDAECGAGMSVEGLSSRRIALEVISIGNTPFWRTSHPAARPNGS